MVVMCLKWYVERDDRTIGMVTYWKGTDFSITGLDLNPDSPAY